MSEKHFKDKEEAELISSFQELANQFEKLQAYEIRNFYNILKIKVVLYYRYINY